MLIEKIEAKMQMAQTNLPPGGLQCSLHVRSSSGVEADGKNQEGEREIADFQDCDTLRTIPLAINWLEPLKGCSAFFSCFQRHPQLVI